MSLTQEQLDIRKTGIGASEMAAACGLSRWSSTIDLYLRKRGEAPDIEETDDMLFGTCIEAGGIEFWSRKNGIPVKHPMPTVRHPEYSHILATPDGKISDEEGLEFKAMGVWRAKQVQEFGLAEVIPEYVIQAQTQMAVMGWKVVRLVALVERTLHEWPVERNDRLIDLLVERSRVFWDHVQRGVPPEIDFSMEGSLKAVTSLYREVKENAVIQLDDEATAMWEAYEGLGKKIKELEKERERYKAFVLGKIGNNYAGLLATGDRMVRRKEMAGGPVSYMRKPSIDVRVVKYDGSPVTGFLADSSEEPDLSFDDAPLQEAVEVISP